MNYQSKPFAAGLDGQGRYTTRQLRAEDASGICDTRPGELDSPEAAFQAEPSTPTPTPWSEIAFMLAVAFGSVACLHVLVSQ